MNKKIIIGVVVLIILIGLFALKMGKNIKVFGRNETTSVNSGHSGFCTFGKELSQVVGVVEGAQIGNAAQVVRECFWFASRGKEQFIVGKFSPVRKSNKVVFCIEGFRAKAWKPFDPLGGVPRFFFQKKPFSWNEGLHIIRKQHSGIERVLFFTNQDNFIFGPEDAQRLRAARSGHAPADNDMTHKTLNFRKNLEAIFIVQKDSKRGAGLGA